MAFDINTAKVVEEEPIKFDINTAKVIEKPKMKFDINTAKVVEKPKMKFDINTAKVVEEEPKTTIKDIVNKVGNSVGGSLFDSVGAIKSMANNVADTVTRPAIDSAKSFPVVTDILSKTVEPVSATKNIANMATQKEYNNVEPILRARTIEDDNAKVIYEPTQWDTLANNIVTASANVKSLEDLQNIKNKQDFAIISAQLPTLALTGGMPLTYLAGFAGLQQLKNLIVTKAKGEDYSPMQIKMLTELLPEDTNEYVKLGVGLLEAAGDTALVGAGANSFKRKVLSIAADDTVSKLKKAGYEVTPEQENKFKTAVEKNADNVSPDDAVAIAVKTKMAKVPEAPKTNDVPKANETIGQGTETIKPEQEPTALVGGQKDKSIVSVDNYSGNFKDEQSIVNLFNSNIDKMSKDNIETFMSGRILPYSTERENKLVKYNPKRVVYADDRIGLDKAYLDNGVYTNGRIAIYNKSLAKKLYEQQKKEHIKRIAKNKDIKNPEQEYQKQIKELVAPDTNKIIPDFNGYKEVKMEYIYHTTERGDKNFYIGILDNGLHIDMNYYSLINKNIPGVKMYAKGTYPIIFKKGNKLEALVMPMRDVENHNPETIDFNKKLSKLVLEKIDELKNINSDLEILKSSSASKELIAEKEKQLEDTFSELQDITGENVVRFMEHDNDVEYKNIIKLENALKVLRSSDEPKKILQAYKDMGLDLPPQKKDETIEDYFNKFKKGGEFYEVMQKQIVDKDIKGKVDNIETTKDNFYKKQDLINKEKLNSLLRSFKENESEPMQELGDVESGTSSYLNNNKINVNHTKDLTDEEIANALNIDSIKNKQYQVEPIDIYNNFVSLHKNFIEKDPTLWDGTVDDFKNLVKWDENNKAALINSPIENIKITESSIHHLFIENDPKRKTKFLRAIRTMENPNLIVDIGRQHYYFKLFDKDGKTKNHFQVVKVVKKGEVYYVTQHSVDRNSTIGKKIKEGQVIYDLSNNRNSTAINGNGAVYSNQNLTMSGNDIIGQKDKIVNKIDEADNNLNSMETHGVKFKIEPNENVSGDKEKVYQRTYDLANKFGVSITESKYRPRNAKGVYYDYGSKKGNVFVNSLLNIDTVTHEVVHAIDDKNSIIDNLYNSSKQNEQQKIILDQLIDCALSHYGSSSIYKKIKKVQAAEGVATMIQMAIVDPTFVKKKYYDAFSYIMQNYPLLKDLYVSARQMIVDYEGLTAVEKVSAQLYDKPLIVDSKSKIPFRVFLDRTVFDSEAILKWLNNDLYLTAKGYRKILGNVIGVNLHNKDGKFYILDVDGNPKELDIKDNWRTFIKKVTKANSNFDEYLITRRFVGWYRKVEEYTKNIADYDLEIFDLERQIKETLYVDWDLIKQLDKVKLEKNKLEEKLLKLNKIIKNNGKNRKEIETAFRELNNDTNKNLAAIYDKLHNATLETLHNSGVIDTELYNEFLNNYGYAPFNRNIYDEIYADDKGNFLKSVVKLAGKDTVVRYKGKNVKLGNLKEMSGSDLAIISPLTSSIRFMASSFREAYKQIVINKLAQIADNMHEFMQKIPYTKGVEHDPNVFVGKIKNEKIAIKIKDADVRNTIQELFDMGLADGAYKVALAATRLFTKLTTGLSPKFAAGNYLRDQMTAFVSSKTGYIPIFSNLQLLASKEAKPYAQEYDILFGGETNSRLGNLTIVNPLEMGNALGETKTEKVVGTIEKPFNFFPAFTESLARKSEYVNMRLSGADIKTASRAAEEITGAFGDFGRWFNSNILKTGIKLNSFLNATLQVAKIYLRAVSNPKTLKKFLWVLGVISAIAFETAREHFDSKDESERIQFLQMMPEMLTRYLYFSGKENNEFIRVPVDNVFASLGVFFAMLYANDRYNARYKVSDMIQVLTDIIPDRLNFAVTGTKVVEDGVSGASRQLWSWTPQVLVPAFGLISGKRVFPDFMDIEPMAIKKLPAKYRFNNRTSETAKWIGNKINVSPMRIDYAIDQSFGQVGKMITRGIERVVYNKNLNTKENFEASINIFKNLSYFASGRLIQDFYDNKRWTDELDNAYKHGFKLSTKEMNFLRVSKENTKKIAKDLQDYRKYAKDLDENKNDLSLDQQQKIKKDLQEREVSIIKKIEQYNKIIRN